MPNSQTILRASSEACSMSLPAPVVMVPRNSSSASAAAHHDRQPRLQILARVGVLIVDRQLHGDAQRHAARNDRHLVQRIGVLAERRHQGVAALVDRP